ncbi:sigma-70 family RNA polymerase sigma factor [Steroidobacter sp. S1-65]|uniref:Sigma-70 family RNA polymerase sigma factor n=1 Tax=Steroidobacter gossypii TaxID=2805490 RepID=A0ABS1WZE3_9GAMM|nr:sigma-70 family RNA polymerase sigma factor [Steroidobacter gossypii]MBM0106346.1 sigma-70 family RNA polymerase sigma factor [Steroidobacter gossypii]
MTEEVRPQLIDYLVKHYGTLKLRVSQLLGNTELAGDALHDAWLRLKTREAEDAIHSPSSYLVRMAVNLAVDVQRRQGRSVSLEEINAAMALSDPLPGPARTAESQAELDELVKLVERMPARRREVFILVHWEGIRQDEVARRLGCSKRTVEYELQRAHQHLTGRLKPVIKKIADGRGPHSSRNIHEDTCDR